jgi:hypothetical protein
MTRATAYQKRHAKARQRRRRTVAERLHRDRRQVQQAAEALQQALDDLGLAEDLVTEIAGRLRSQHKLLGKIVGVMCPPLFGCRTNTLTLPISEFGVCSCGFLVYPRLCTKSRSFIEFFGIKTGLFGREKAFTMRPESPY